MLAEELLQWPWLHQDALPVPTPGFLLVLRNPKTTFFLLKQQQKL